MTYDERGRRISGTVEEFLCQYLLDGYQDIMSFYRYLALQERAGIEVIGFDRYRSKRFYERRNSGDV